MILLTALMAAQFLVHAVGWAMAAAMQRQPRGPEGHFAAFWAAIALALGLYLVARQPVLHLLGDALVVLATLLVHRGVLRFYRQPLPDRRYLAAALVAAAALVFSATLGDAPRWRMALLSSTLALGCAALALTFWRHGRRRSLWLAGVVAAALLVAALALAALDPQHRLDTGVAIGLFFVAGLFNLAQIRLVLGRVLQRLVAQTQRDALTGVANRHGFMLALQRVHRHALHGGVAYALLMVDIDHFKRINDEQGHAAGDAALRRVARLLAESVRGDDVVGRLGGEEFCLLLPAVDLQAASGLAQRVCSVVAAQQALTVSVGVALVNAATEGAEAALARADAALYRAKHEGRNRVVQAPPVKALPTC